MLHLQRGLHRSEDATLHAHLLPRMPPEDRFADVEETRTDPRSMSGLSEGVLSSYFRLDRHSEEFPHKEIGRDDTNLKDWEATVANSGSEQGDRQNALQRLSGRLMRSVSQEAVQQSGYQSRAWHCDAGKSLDDVGISRVGV